MTLSLAGKTFVVMGVANKRSIAWGIARSLIRIRSTLDFYICRGTLRKKCSRVAASLEGNNSLVLPCDVTNDEEIAKCFNEIKEKVGTIHGIAHCIAFANKEELDGDYMNTTRDGFLASTQY